LFKKMPQPHANHKPPPDAAPPESHTAPIKLVALDLDGTLLDSNKQIDPETEAALKDACARGIHVVIASARPPRGVRHIYRQLCLSTWQINYNGALIWDESRAKPVFHRPMKAQLVKDVIERARDQFDELGVHVEVMDKWLTDRPIQGYVTETGRLFAPDVIDELCNICVHPVTKLMFMGEPQMLMKIEPLLLESFSSEVTIVSTDAHLMQIMSRHVSKASALKRVAAHHGVKPSEIMAVGDAPNDLGMLQFAGVAVAMENGHPVVKEQADWVAPGNDSRGVLAALRKFGVA
jgi:5-amino-6-(5-phospho-D-ribitylamino)uracil phosphatase